MEPEESLDIVALRGLRERGLTQTQVQKAATWFPHVYAEQHPDILRIFERTPKKHARVAFETLDRAFAEMAAKDYSKHHKSEFLYALAATLPGVLNVDNVTRARGLGASAAFLKSYLWKRVRSTGIAPRQKRVAAAQMLVSRALAEEGESRVRAADAFLTSKGHGYYPFYLLAVARTLRFVPQSKLAREMAGAPSPYVACVRALNRRLTEAKGPKAVDDLAHLIETLHENRLAAGKMLR